MSDVKLFGAAGDGVADDTAAIRHAAADGDGLLEFPRGVYRISETIEMPLGVNGPAALLGDEGTARVIMAGPGPAFRLVGGHDGTGDPWSVSTRVWERERMPTVRNLVVEGAHPDADGFALVKTMQTLFEGVLVRRVRHGIHLTGRNRNVIIGHSHIYHNSGAGIYLEGVNLHQINITGCHISYNRLGGIRIERSEVRNLQITGNDIEYNNGKSHGGLPEEPTAEIHIDATADGASVNEVAISSNTIQATPGAGGANIRIRERPGNERPPGLVTISGNVIGSQETNIHLSGCYGVTLSGNTVYSAGYRNLLLEDCRQIAVGTTLFRRHTPAMGVGVRLVGSRDCVISGCVFRDESEEGQASGASLLELEGCRRINVTGCQFIDGVPYGIDARDCSQVRVGQCTIADTRETRRARGAARFAGTGKGNHLALNTLEGGLDLGPESGVALFENAT